MRPEWLQCGTCLFFMPEATTNLCCRSPKPIQVQYNQFCASWTCRRCLGMWRDVKFEYASPERQLGREYHYIINHFECKEESEE